MPRRLPRQELTRFAVGMGLVLLTVVLVELIGRQASGSESPVAAGTVILGLGLAAAVAFGIARDSSVGILVWLFAALFTETLPGVPLERLTFLALVGGWFIAVVTGRRPLQRFGLTELLMLVYLLINVISFFAPHTLPADNSLTPLSLILRGGLFPFTAFVIARQTMTDRRAVKSFLVFVIALGLYVALMAIFYKIGPRPLVFPRQILDPELGINPERGRGPLLNSAADGLTMVAGMIAAIFLSVQADVRRRKLVIASALIIPIGIFFTQTRAIWLAAALAVVLGTMFARGFRRWYVVVLASALAVVGINWQKFLSADRQQGGVASPSEIESRLNDWATAIWAIDQEKLVGWGISRFPEVNTIHHQNWGNIDWELGRGFIGHNTHLTIGAELGWIGLGTWLAIIGAVTIATARAWIVLPQRGLLSRGFVFSFWCAWIGFLINAGLVEMRVFTFLMGLFFVWAGIAAGLGDRALRGELEPEPDDLPPPPPPEPEAAPEFAYETGFR